MSSLLCAMRRYTFISYAKDTKQYKLSGDEKKDLRQFPSIRDSVHSILNEIEVKYVKCLTVR